MGSPQTLSETDRRVLAMWAADCTERVLPLFEAEAPRDSRPRQAIDRTRAFARGELAVADQIRRRFVAAGAARDVKAPAAAAAARAAGQAAAVPHMGAHALGAAAYAAKAAGLGAPEQQDAIKQEIRWQLGCMSAAVTAALRQLPPVGENTCPSNADTAHQPLTHQNAATGLSGVLKLNVPLRGTHSTPPLAWQRRYPHRDGWILPWDGTGHLRTGLTFGPTERGVCNAGSQAALSKSALTCTVGSAKRFDPCYPPKADWHREQLVACPFDAGSKKMTRFVLKR